MTMPDTRPIIVRGSDTRALKDYATEHVELAWISPFRKYAPAVLVLCVAALLAVAVLLPLWAMPECAPTLTAKLLLVLIYAALAALGGYLFITANALEQAHQRDVESTRELARQAIQAGIRRLVGKSERLTGRVGRSSLPVTAG